MFSKIPVTLCRQYLCWNMWIVEVTLTSNLNSTIEMKHVREDDINCHKLMILTIK